MTGVMASLVFLHRFREQEGSPVGDATDDTALREDDGAGGAGDAIHMSRQSLNCVGDLHGR